MPFRGFHDVGFPVPVARGARVTTRRRTEIVTLGSGHEERNARWRHARRTYDAGGGLRSVADLVAVQRFFEARMGQLYAFRFRDPLDHASGTGDGPPSATDEALGTGDGATASFALQRVTGGGPARPIPLPVPGTVAVAVDGVPAPFTLGATGRVTLATPPPAGAAVTAGFLFDVAVRFDTDALDIDLTAFRAGSLPSIPLIEVLLREAGDA